MLGLCFAVSTDNRAVKVWWMSCNMKKVNYGSLCFVFCCTHFAPFNLLYLTRLQLWSYAEPSLHTLSTAALYRVFSEYRVSNNVWWLWWWRPLARRLQRQVLQLPLIAQINQPPREGLTTPLCGLKWSKQSSKRLLTTQGLLQKL